MSISLATGAVVATADETIDLAMLFAVAATAASPAQVVLSILDRDVYTAGFTTADFGTLSGTTVSGTDTGTLSLGFTAMGATYDPDGYSIGLIFTKVADSSSPTGYVYEDRANGLLLSSVAFTTGSFTTDNVSFSLFTAGATASIGTYDANPYVLALNAGQYSKELTYIGSVSVVTEPAAAPAPSQATPDSIVAAALSFVGQAWNPDGCWTLASNIAAEAGASLPVISALVGPDGMANGEWIVAYNGPLASNANWESILQAGEMVVFAPVGGSGHITTVVSGSGTSAELVDNIVYVSGSTTLNLAPDGTDVIVAAPHPASEEFTGVNAGEVVVYELDAPVVTATVTLDSVGEAASIALGALYAATNPLAGQSIAAYQVYGGDAGASLSASGSVTAGATSAASAITVASLADVALLTGALTGTDTVEVRASNGTYWGDWTGIVFDVTATGDMSCFLAGTRIATPEGEAPVEALRPGDRVCLAEGRTAPVHWVGWHTVARRFADPVRAWPIRVRAGALGADVPRRDLLLSPCHALLVGGVLAEARTLLNGTTIRREPPPGEAFVYWHVELDMHALLLAEGAPAESFLDALQEFPFDNRATRPAPDAAVNELPYPRCKSPRQVPRAVRVLVAARAGGWRAAG